MNLADFIDLVRQMRAAQKQYFLRRTSGDLRDAKSWEALVDEAIRQWDEKQAEAAQPGLGL